MKITVVAANGKAGKLIGNRNHSGARAAQEAVQA
jgi:hypothetical protein